MIQAPSVRDQSGLLEAALEAQDTSPRILLYRIEVAVDEP